MTMTNLLATIAFCIVTNVSTNVEREVVGRHAIPCPEGRIGCLVYHSEIEYGKEIAKTETTEVSEIMTITIDPRQLVEIGWAGGLIEGKQTRVLSKAVRRWTRRDDWVADE